MRRHHVVVVVVQSGRCVPQLRLALRRIGQGDELLLPNTARQSGRQTAHGEQLPEATHCCCCQCHLRLSLSDHSRLLEVLSDGLQQLIERVSHVLLQVLGMDLPRDEGRLQLLQTAASSHQSRE